MADYNAVLQVRPNNPYARNNRGALYLRKGALQSALDDFNTALTIFPGHVLAHINRARVLIANMRSLPAGAAPGTDPGTALGGYFLSRDTFRPVAAMLSCKPLSLV